MYLEHYGLREKPFNLAPDPRFLYFTDAHREALAQLTYGIGEGLGFIVLTGEVGTGKTTLLRALLERLGHDTEVAFVFNSLLPFDEILEYALEDFGIASLATTRAQRLFSLNVFLTDRCRRGLKSVLVIDEAQNLDVTVLEQIRLLSNFETSRDKLLQIVLVGQPELGTRLERSDLRQLKQRIGLRCAIHPLTYRETGEYIRHRLQVARGEPQGSASEPELFTEGAIDRISRYSAGTPRVVNVLCDHCLLVGFADRKPRIERETVDEAIRYMEGGGRPKKGFSLLGFKPAALKRWVGAL